MMNLSTFLLLLIAAPSVNSFTANSQPPNVLKTTALSSSRSSSSTDKTSSAKRAPWDFVRFVRQSSKFVSLPKPPTRPNKIQPGDILWEPSSSSSSFSWGPLDDVVMGGASSSNFNNNDGEWSGFVTDTNSGGFVGIRTTPFKQALDMSSCSGVEFKLTGTGSKQFKAVLRDSTEFNGICWTDTFGGASRWGLWSNNDSESDKEVKVKVPFEKLVPTIFAKTVPNVSLKKDNIVGFQLVYSKVRIEQLNVGSFKHKFPLFLSERFSNSIFNILCKKVFI